MKFHCDRCNTRYSIADERVRGKILKIRCKNCSAVITVREGMGARRASAAASKSEVTRKSVVQHGPVAGKSSALQGAFAQAMERDEPAVPAPAPEISPSQSFRAPDHISEEWYVSVDGDQFGPYDLSRAKEWVLGRELDDELHCWKEDFDDWLPIDKVSHFRGLRARADTTALGALDPPVPPPPVTSRPGISSPARGGAGPAAELDQRAATVQGGSIFDAVDGASSAGSSNGASNGASASFDAGALFPDEEEDDDDGLSLDIGEASRIVNLNHIMPPSGSMNDELDQQLSSGSKEPLAAAPVARALPGVAKLPKGRPSDRIGVGSGAHPAVVKQVPLAPLSESAVADAKPQILIGPDPAPHHRPAMLIPLLIAGVVISAVVGVLIYVSTSGGDSGKRLARSSVGGDDLARRIDRPARTGKGSATDGLAAVETGDDGKTPTTKPGTTRAHRPRVIKSGNTSTTTTIEDNGPKVPVRPGDNTVRALGPSDVIIMSRKQALGNRRCYERALKKDPFLDVKNMKVTMTVAASGVVTAVTMKNSGGTFLGQCLASRIRRWPFRKSTKGITMTLTLSFEQS